MIVDAAAHPVVRHGDELREYMPEPWRSRPFPGPERYQYAAPDGEYAERPESGLPGSDPAALPRAADVVVLLPLTRGLLPNIDLGSAICAATNAWLADVWLRDARCRGSIRVNPSDPNAAVAEIERWAEDPRFVQVAIPVQSHHPYGHRSFYPIWAAAARHRLPVALHVDGGAGVDFPPTPVGYPRYAIEYAALHPFNAVYHLASFVAEGVFSRLDDFRLVLADGGLDAMTPIVWRLDRDWRSEREAIPWARHAPSSEIRDHVRVCAHRVDLPRDGATLESWLEISGAAELLMWASNHPQWDTWDPETAFAGIDRSVRAAIMGGTASGLYDLVPAGTAPPA
jgi:predicted TIM-barrel fold metal-dependent hydrolase